MASKYARLLSNANVRRWHENVSRGSKITADVYLRRAGSFCASHGVTLKQFSEIGPRRAFDLMLDTVGAMERQGRAGSYIESVLKAVKSWLAFNDVEIRRKIKVRGARETPTLSDERVPTRDELRKILLAGTGRGRVVCAFLAFSGLRPQVLGSYDGTEGLRLGDLPDLRTCDGEVSFSQIPAMVKVRPILSKTGYEYFTFLGTEGCEYVKAFLEARLRGHERLTEDSPVVVSGQAKRQFIMTTKVGEVARKAIRGSGYRWRPYVLRSYFDTQMMLAEAKGLIIRDYRSFFMGHKGDIEAVYTLRKRRLPTEVVEQMRDSYRKALPHLQTIDTGDGPEELTKEFKRQLLRIAGFEADEIGQEHLDLDDDGFQKVVRERLLGHIKSQQPWQKVVDVRDVERHLRDGWQFVAPMPDNRAVIKLPDAA